LFTGLYVLNCPKGAQQENMTVTRAVRQTLSKQANGKKNKNKEMKSTTVTRAERQTDYTEPTPKP
jgi:hypothetical protein